MHNLRFLLVALTIPVTAQDSDKVFEPFEGDGFGTWEETGTAFGKAPTAGGHGELAGKVQGYAGESFASSFAQGDAGTGSLTSPPFTIELPYISFLVGGGSAAGQTAVQLVVGDKVVREEVGQDDNLLRPRTWDVRDLIGQEARLRLLDSRIEASGYIMADHLVFTDYPNTKFPNSTRDGKPFDPGLVSTEVIPGVTLPAGVELKVFATFQDHQVYSPTALCIDEQGRLLVTETHRFRYGIPDNRHHRYWHSDDIAALTIDDRRKMHEKWDKKFPVADMKTKSEKIRLLIDTDQDGVADVSKVFAEGFNDLLDGTGAGVYSYEGRVYFACIPNLWMLRDTDDDGVADERKKLVTGFGTRVSLSGHDMNGFALGPDGRLYGSIGDRAMNVTTAEGLRLAYTDQGAVFRFDPDGSNFEVVHAGLRNPKEIAFDQWGNCISVDNNSDQGDKARVVYIVDGADSGWRTDHQNLHTFHREVGYQKRPINQWMQERQWDKHHEGQPAFLLPPIDTLTSGPSGLTYHPGTGFSHNCVDSFLVCDYRGGAASSGIWAFGIEPDGASMKMVNPRRFNWGAAVTDVEFGYDGRLYVTDFVSGWESHSAGRVYTLSSPESVSSEETREVSALFREGFRKRTAQQLYDLMSHADHRVRLRAQIVLADRPEAVPFFINATRQTESRRLCLHGVWGLWMKARKDRSEASTEQLVELLGHGESEIRAQAARALGEAPLKDHGRLINSLQDQSARVKSFAAISLTRLRSAQAFNPTLVLLAENADRDPYLRHAGVMCLLGAGTERQIANLRSHPNPSIRLAAVLALRRLHSPSLLHFFFDKEHAHISDEAIRAVHDVPVERARLAVAALLDEYAPGQQGRPLSRMMLRRLLHSAFRVGGAENAGRLMRAAANEALNEHERLEALRLLSVWTNPPVVDQSLGRHAPLEPRNLGEIKSTLETEIIPLLSLKGEVLAAAIALVTQYNLSAKSLDEVGLLLLLGVKDLGSLARSRTLELLVKRNPENLQETLAEFAEDADVAFAARALELLAEKFPAAALDPVKEALTSQDKSRAQRAWRVLAGLPGEGAATLVEQGVRDLIAGKLSTSVALEVVEAAGGREEESVQNALGDYYATLPVGDPLAAFRISLVGGNPKRGYEIFHTHPAAQCLRCHRIDDGHSEGGEAGPNLAGIGVRHDANYFLESLIVPNAVVAPGFGIISISFKNGTSKSGILVAETEETVDLLEGKDLWRVKKTDIEKRTKPISAMAPPMGAVLTKRELRDLVSWLGTLKEGAPPAPPKREVQILDPARLQTPEKDPAPEPEPTPPAPAPRVTPSVPRPAPVAIPEPPHDLDPAMMEAGQTGYIICVACHGDKGQGIAGTGGPPLARSEWVNGPVENLIRIQLRGLKGDIKVAGRQYLVGTDMLPTGMVALPQNSEQIAAVLTYIRNSFGNSAPGVTTEMVDALRDEIGKPQLRVSDLITPPPLIDGAKVPAKSEPKKPGFNAKGLLIFLALLAWCGLCLVPILRRFKSRDQTASE
ncbi:MAG: c-type cytochrome [Roseibacillus sp.]